jgi:hypothetical protein
VDAEEVAAFELCVLCAVVVGLALLVGDCRFGHRLTGPIPERKTEIKFVLSKLMPWHAA